MMKVRVEESSENQMISNTKIGEGDSHSNTFLST